MPFQISGGECVNCGACEAVCPMACIKNVQGIRMIHEEQCSSCGACAKICPVKCIEQTEPVREKTG